MAKGTVNKVIILGKLGQDPDVRTVASTGNSIANLSVATNEVWRNKDTGQTEEQTEWHRVICFGRTAEIAAQYLRKGSSVYVEGKLQTRKWQDKNGQDRWTTEIRVSELQLMGGRSDDQGGQQGYSQQGYGQQGDYGQQQQRRGLTGRDQQPQGYGQRPAPQQQPSQHHDADPIDDEIPF